MRHAEVTVALVTVIQRILESRRLVPTLMLVVSTADKRALLVLFGVDEKASWEELRHAFRTAVRATHPDLHAGDPNAEWRLKTLNIAWESVNTPLKWSEFIAPTASPAGLHGSPPGRSNATQSPVGRLQVLRQRAGSAGLRRWKIELDGEVVATIENGSTILLEVGPGEHSLRVFYEGYSSPPLELKLRGGDELVLGCRQQSNPLLSLYAPKRSLVLEHIGSRRFVSR